MTLLPYKAEFGGKVLGRYATLAEAQEACNAAEKAARPVVEVIEARRWRNSRTGQAASLYGAVPWTRPADRSEWHIEVSGWTWRNRDGTIGLGRVPAATREEAEEVMRAINAR